MTKMSEFRAKTDDELQKSLLSLKKEQFNLRFQKANMDLNNTSQIRENRRDIARLRFLLSQKVSSDASKTGV